MKASARTILEILANPGQDPTLQVDTDDLDPPVYDNLVSRLIKTVQVATGATDQALDLPAGCLVLLVSDEPVLLRLDTGETQMRVRVFLVGAEDETGAALPASTILLSGNGTNLATVDVYVLGQVA